MSGYAVLFVLLIVVIVNVHGRGGDHNGGDGEGHHGGGHHGGGGGGHHGGGGGGRHGGGVGAQRGGGRKGRNFKKHRDNDWTNFKSKFKRQFKDQDDDDDKRSKWEARMDRIEKHNNDYTNKKRKFRMGINRFADKDATELKKLSGYINPFAPGLLKGPSPEGLIRFNLTDDDPKTQQKFVDYRAQGAVTSVKNQGDCGGCWSFASTAALEGHYKLATGKLVDLSEQGLIDCSKPEGNTGCEGGAMVFAFRYIFENGIMKEKGYPFEEKDDKCKYNPANVVTKIQGYVMIPENDEEALRKAVSAVGPVTAAIHATDEDFMLYEDGIYDEEDCSSTELDHGVLVVGYGTEDGDDYWLIKNSWGPDWGMDGFIKLARNAKNLCGIATQASYPII